MIKINESSAVPIYQQIYDGFVQLIVLKVLSEEEKLPSVRELALILKINPNTIQKAYKSLEKDRYIKACKGKGNFVSAYNEVLEIYRHDIDDVLKEKLKALKMVGDSEIDILNSVKKILEVI